MSTVTYTKGLPTPAEELNELGFTQFEMFLNAYAPIYRPAVCETVNHLLSGETFNKSQWNTHLQQIYRINKRHANGVIADALGKVSSAKESRQNHIKQLQGKLKSTQEWIRKAERKLKLARKFYSQKNWQHSPAGCIFPIASSVQYRDTNWQHLRFQIHQKKRKACLYERKISYLKLKPIRVKVPHSQCFVVGSKAEKWGNQVCQWDGVTIKFRVPACLEDRFGEYVTTRLGGYDRKINRLPSRGAKSWHFYLKNRKWNIAVQFTPTQPSRVSRHSSEGCIGIDMNPGSIGWAYVDPDGNLKAKGQIPMQMGIPKGQQDAQIADACLQLATLANLMECPIVCEDLDFSRKKEHLKECGSKYARILSGWAYARFYELLESILSNRGIDLLKVNPAYTSLIGLVKYVRQYGLASDEAAALVVARRRMKLKELIPSSITAYLDVKSGKHVWSLWYQLNKLLKSCNRWKNRHSFYSVSNWGLEVKEMVAPACGRSQTKRKRTSS
ncbi:MAG: hypothetical protein EBE86_018040 [Hormoscilla sp. GUM202]|nr:hypothetical protein [Hormoscilla sp. GUM202]